MAENIAMSKRGTEPAPELKETGQLKTGVAFSGGGIRSAALCSGVLRRLLQQKAEPDYLSCVSGGGYTGTAYLDWKYRSEQKDDPSWHKRFFEHMLSRTGHICNWQKPLYGMLDIAMILMLMIIVNLCVPLLGWGSFACPLAFGVDFLFGNLLRGSRYRCNETIEDCEFPEGSKVYYRMLLFLIPMGFFILFHLWTACTTKCEVLVNLLQALSGSLFAFTFLPWFIHDYLDYTPHWVQIGVVLVSAVVWFFLPVLRSYSSLVILIYAFSYVVYWRVYREVLLGVQHTDELFLYLLFISGIILGIASVFGEFQLRLIHIYNRWRLQKAFYTDKSVGRCGCAGIGCYDCFPGSHIFCGPPDQKKNPSNALSLHHLHETKPEYISNIVVNGWRKDNNSKPKFRLLTMTPKQFQVIDSQPQTVNTTQPQEVNATQPQEVNATQPQEVNTTQPQEVNATQPQEVNATQPQEVNATQPQEVNATQPQEVNTTQPQEVNATQPQEVNNTPPQEVYNTPPQTVNNTPPQPVNNNQPEKVYNTPPQTVNNNQPQTANTNQLQEVNPTQPQNPQRLGGRENDGGNDPPSFGNELGPMDIKLSSAMAMSAAAMSPHLGAFEEEEQRYTHLLTILGLEMAASIVYNIAGERYENRWIKFLVPVILKASIILPLIICPIIYFVNKSDSSLVIYGFSPFLVLVVLLFLALMNTGKRDGNCFRPLCRWMIVHVPLFRFVRSICSAVNTGPVPPAMLHLSDGGHFENLAILPLFKRRLEKIVVVNGGYIDSDSCYGDELVHAMELAREMVNCSFTSMDGGDVLTDIKDKFVKRPEERPRKYEFKVHYEEVGEQIERSKIREGHVVLIAPRHPRTGLRRENEAWRTVGLDLESGLWGDGPVLTSTEVDNLTFCCCECCHGSGCCACISNKLCGVFPHHKTANQFFTPAMFSAYHREGYRACMEASIVDFFKVQPERADREEQAEAQ